MEATATLAGGIAHDFNNLMVGVLGNAEMLKSDLADQPEAVEILDEIAKVGRRAGDLGEPREALIADLTGDGRNDLVIVVHDRILLYPQE